MQQCPMDYPHGLSGDRDIYQCLFAVVEVQAGQGGGLWEQGGAQEPRAW